MIIHISDYIRAGLRRGPASILIVVITILMLANSAAAQNVEKKITSDSILGIGIGSKLSDAHLKLDPLGINGGRDTRENGRKEAWTFRNTRFVSLALKTNKQGSVVWISGFLRPGQEIPFSELGDISQATLSNDSQAVWNIHGPAGDYRLVAKGEGQKARIIYLLSTVVPPVE